MLKWSELIALALAPLWYLLHITPIGKALEELYEYKGD